MMEHVKSQFVTMSCMSGKSYIKIRWSTFVFREFVIHGIESSKDFLSNLVEEIVEFSSITHKPCSGKALTQYNR